MSNTGVFWKGMTPETHLFVATWRTRVGYIRTITPPMNHEQFTFNILTEPDIDFYYGMAPWEIGLHRLDFLLLLNCPQGSVL